MASQPLFEYHITTEKGIEYTFDNLSEFCRTNKISKNHLRDMINKGTPYKGWSGYKIKIEKEIVISHKAKNGRIKGRLFEYHIKDIEGNEYVFKDLTTFCKENNICKQSIHNLIESNSYYKGWSGYKIQLK